MITSVVSEARSREPTVEPGLKVAYLLHRFPHFTETFVTRELLSMQGLGLDLAIFSLHRPKHRIVHGAVEPLLPLVRYRPFLSRQVLADQAHFFRRSPRRYVAAARQLLRQTWREPVALLRALSLFPKSVSFAREIEAGRFDHMHAHFVWLGAIAAGVISDITGTTFTVHPHAFGLFSRNQKDVREQLRHASGVIAISSYHAGYIADLCPDLPPESVTLVRLGVDTDAFVPAQGSVALHPPVILCVGRLVRKKGHEYLIAACRQLADRGVPFQCWIVGDGPRRARLESLVERNRLAGRFRFLGSVSQEMVLRLYQESSLFALPCVTTWRGDQDGMPYVLIEAMACGVPVVTTPIAGIPDLVRSGENGLLVPERDAGALAEALERLIADADARTQLGQEARRTVLTEFNTLRNAGLLAQVFCRSSESTRRVSATGGPLR